MSHGELMPWAKAEGTAITVENLDISVGNALRRVKEKVETRKEREKADFMDIQVFSKKDGTLKVLGKVEKIPKVKEKASKEIVGIVASLATYQMNVKQSRSFHLINKQSRLGEFWSWHALRRVAGTHAV